MSASCFKLAKADFTAHTIIYLWIAGETLSPSAFAYDAKSDDWAQPPQSNQILLKFNK